MAKNGNTAEFVITYDPEADAVAIDLPEQPQGRVRTQHLTDDWRADFDAQGQLVGFELLNASRHWPRGALERLPNGIEWLTVSEAAKESGIAASTLRNQISAGRLPAVKRGRDWLVAGHELWNYLEKRAPQGRRSKRERSRALRTGGRAPRSRRGAAGSAHDAHEHRVMGGARSSSRVAGSTTRRRTAR